MPVVQAILFAALVSVASIALVTTSDRAPAFSVQLLDEDRVFTEADLPGGYTLISFWSTTCGPCIREMTHLHEAYEHFEDRLEILSISRDGDPQAVQDFRRDRHAMPWLNAVVGARSEVFDAFGVDGTPHLALVAPNGNIVARTKDLTGERLLRTLHRFGLHGCR